MTSVGQKARKYSALLQTWGFGFGAGLAPVVVFGDLTNT